MVTKETRALIKGEYGRLPAEPDPETVKKILGGEPRIEYRPADVLKPEYEKYKEEIGEYYEQEEDVLSYALFPQVALNYFKYRQAKKYGADGVLGDKKNLIHPV
jgi:oxaloacetate decarboxylase alpha subunit